MDEKIIELLMKIQNDIIEVKIDVKYVKEKIDNVYEQTSLAKTPEGNPKGVEKRELELTMNN